MPNSKSKYANKPITIAAKLAPGIPNKTVGIMEVAFCALLAPSGPMTPLMLPLPNLSFGWLATVELYAIQSATAPPKPGNSPINAPMTPPRRASHLLFHTASIPSLVCLPLPSATVLVFVLCFSPDNNSGMAKSPATSGISWTPSPRYSQPPVHLSALVLGSTPISPTNNPIHKANKLLNQNLFVTKVTHTRANIVNAHNSGTPNIIINCV